MDEILRAFDTDESKILESRIMLRSVPKICGIYFLIKDRTIVYVGKSIDIMSRISTHRNYKVDFDSYSYIECASNLDVLEAYFFCKFRPEYNGVLPTNNYFFSVRQLKIKFNTTIPRVKKFIRENKIKPYGGEYYCIKDFAKYHDKLAKPTPSYEINRKGLHHGNYDY